MTTAAKEGARPRRARRTNWRALRTLAAVSILTALAIRWNADRNNLLLQARRVPGVDTSQAAGQGERQWLSPDRLLSFVCEVDKRAFKLVEIDAHTGRRTELRALNARMGNRRLAAARQCRLSPDRRWLLCTVKRGRSNHFVAVTLDGSQLREWPIDTATAYLAVNPAWMPDSRRWGYLLYDERTRRSPLVVYRVDRQEAPVIVELHPPTGIMPTRFLGFDAQGRAVALGSAEPPARSNPATVVSTGVTRVTFGTPGIAGHTPVTATTTNRSSTRSSPGTPTSGIPTGIPNGTSTRSSGQPGTLSTRGYIVQGASPGARSGLPAGIVSPGTSAPQVTIFSANPLKSPLAPDHRAYLLAFQPENGTASQYTLTLPDQPTSGEMALSPVGDRVVYLHSETHPPLLAFLPTWLSQWLHLSPPTPSEETSIWTFRVDGTDVHQVGPPLVQSSQMSTGLSDPDWLPDGSRISFMHDNHLYTLPAN